MDVVHISSSDSEKENEAVPSTRAVCRMLPPTIAFVGHSRGFHKWPPQAVSSSASQYNNWRSCGGDGIQVSLQSSNDVINKHLPRHSRNQLPEFMENNRVMGYDACNGQTDGSSDSSTVSNSWISSNVNRGTRSNDQSVVHLSDKPRVLPASISVNEKHTPGLKHGGIDSNSHHAGGMLVEGDETSIYQAALQGLVQPRGEIDVSHGLLAVDLLRHQKIALAWMIQKETTDPNCLGGILADDQGLGKTVTSIALIKMLGPRAVECRFSNQLNGTCEPLYLDEDDEAILKIGKEAYSVTPEDSEMKDESTTSLFASWCKGRPSGGTLIVSPASVLRQWARELKEKVSDEAKLSFLIYHGGSRTKDPAELASYDVVLTTYSIVSNEVPGQNFPDNGEGELVVREKDPCFADIHRKQKKAAHAGKKGKKRKGGTDYSYVDCDSGPLARVSWFRVVLDEAQTIKNRKTQVARACYGLRAKRRWCLSGTPIQNTIDDLYSYFRFLRYDPYASYKLFCSAIKHPIARNSIQGYMKLQAVLNTIMLRRTKDTLLDGKPILRLPSRSVSLKKVDFTPEERSFYSNLEAHSRSQFKKYADAGTVSQNYANILVMLLRLRQACDHPLLVEGFSSGLIGRACLDRAGTLPRETLGILLDLLDPSFALCGECGDPPEDAVVTICGHVFCRQCLSDWLLMNDFCPVEQCKHQLGPDGIFSRATLLTCISEGFQSSSGVPSDSMIESDTSKKDATLSSKIKAALEILYSVCKQKSGPTCQSDEDASESLNRANSSLLPSEHPMHSNLLSEASEKAIVFSQWTGMLDLLEISLKKSGIKFRRLDGTMSLPARDKAVREFTTDPEVLVMIMSLKAGNLGLNMTAANHVIILDLWWNPTTEDQAIDRAHRIGQTRPVTISRLTVKDTVEDRILTLQEEKRKIVSSAFGDQTGGPASRLTVEDLSFLFMGGSL